MRRPSIAMLLLLVAACLAAEARSFGSESGFPEAPDPEAMAGAFRSAGILSLRDRLAGILLSSWVPASSPGHDGKQEAFLRWADSYRWVDLLSSQEAAVTKRWLSRHLAAERDSRGNVTILLRDPGSAPLARHDALQHEATERAAADPILLRKMLTRLIAKPFVPKNGILATRLNERFIGETLRNPEFLELWCTHESQDDFAPKVLTNLQEIYLTSPSDFREFLKLALAVSLIRDQPAPSWWPHRQVRPSDVPRADHSAAEVFAEIVSAFRRGELLRDPRQLGVRELMFVADPPLAFPELEWGRKHGTAWRQEPSSALASVRYDGRRIASGRYVWPWGAYLLGQIDRRGGICVDQAYEAAITGKSLGIPCLMFVGAGREGGHAWVGYLRPDGIWDFGVGRPASGGLLTGETLDPQNWAPVTDHDMEWLSADEKESRKTARGDLVMASVFRFRNDAEGEGRALRSALARDPRNPETWDSLEDWMVRTGASASELASLHRSAMKSLSYSRDLVARHEEALSLIQRDSGKGGEAEHLERKIIGENAATRADLSASAAATLVLGKLNGGDLDGALREYRRQLAALGPSGRGNFFYRVTSPLSLALLAGNHADLSLVMLRETGELIKPREGSPLAYDFRKLWIASGGR